LIFKPQMDTGILRAYTFASAPLPTVDFPRAQT
jgi:hypothetical protein